MNITVKEKSRNVHIVESTVKGGWEQWYLLISDTHRDNPDCKDELLLKHLNQAKQRDAGILIFGDYFCCMQGKYDKRADKSKLRPEHRGTNYFDLLNQTEVQFLKPYVNNLILITEGNHENGVRKNHEFDLLDRLVGALNTSDPLPSIPVFKGGYGGYVVFKFVEGPEGSVQRSQSIKLKYRHSGGSLGEITKGTLGVDRMAKTFPDADIIVTGDNHEAWTMEIVQEKLNAQFNVEQRTQLHIKTATYKDEYKVGHSGWHVERNAPPKPLGGYWLRFYYIKNEIKYEIIRTEQ